MPTLKSVKSLCHRVLRGAPLPPRTRYRPPSSSPELFFILVFSPVHRIRLAALFTGFVSETVLLSRSPSEPYRDAFAALDADVDET